MSDYENMPTHVRNCLDAIDSIGGDPATVQELVAVLRMIADDYYNVFHLTIAQQDGIAAVLAKLPEVK